MEHVNVALCATGHNPGLMHQAGTAGVLHGLGWLGGQSVLGQDGPGGPGPAAAAEQLLLLSGTDRSYSFDAQPASHSPCQTADAALLGSFFLEHPNDRICPGLA